MRRKFGKGSVALLLANLLGITIYLYIEHWILSPAFFDDASDGFSTLYYWGRYDGPVLLVAAAANIFFFVLEIRKPFEKRISKGMFFSIAPLPWLLAMAINGIGYRALIIAIILIKSSLAKGL